MLKHLFLMCNDVGAMKQFYGDVLGLTVTSHEPDGLVGFAAGTTEMLFFKADFVLPAPEEFAWQPGYRAGSANATSWSIEVDKARFPAVLARLKAAAHPLLRPDAEVRCDRYVAVTTRDPMGTTVEVWCDK